MKKVKKVLVAMLALTLGIMLTVPALAVQPRIEVMDCPACGRTAYTNRTKEFEHGEVMEDGTWVNVYKITIRIWCNSCPYKNEYSYNVHE